MKIYVAMINDRHSDPTPSLFSKPESAIAYARSCAEEFAETPEMVFEQEVAGWLYYATYSNEGDSVWVVERELDGD